MSHKLTILGRPLSTNQPKLCLYTAIEFAISKPNLIKAFMEGCEKANKTICVNSANLKRRLKPDHVNFAGEEELTKLAKYLKRSIHVYNNVYQHVETYEGKPSSRNTKPKDAIEIQRRDSHNLALIRYHPGEEKNTLIQKINNVQEAKEKGRKADKNTEISSA